MARTDAALAKIRKIYLSLPGTKETMTWGEPHFRVGEKIFAGYGEENGKRGSASSWKWPMRPSLFKFLGSRARLT